MHANVPSGRECYEHYPNSARTAARDLGQTFARAGILRTMRAGTAAEVVPHDGAAVHYTRGFCAMHILRRRDVRGDKEEREMTYWETLIGSMGIVVRIIGITAISAAIAAIGARVCPKRWKERIWK